MSRPAIELADIFRQYAEKYIETHGHTSTEQKRVLKAIQQCRTAALGGHVQLCDRCGYEEICYNSCRNRHCPKCQAMARADWLKDRQGELLPAEYFHVIFTIPEEFRLLALQNKRTVYGILFRAAAETLRKVARDPKHLGAEIGFFGILHTWGQNLQHHPHVHFVIPGGGLAFDKSKWISTPKRFFLPIAVLKIVFRAKFLNYLERAFNQGKLSFKGKLESLARAKAFKALLIKASKHQWAVQARPPFANPTVVLKYLARYTHRVAISNQRIVSINDGNVTFRWKDYADHDRKKIMTLSVFEFIRRFLLHVLPLRFHRIRYYGFLAPGKRTENLQLCRKLLSQSKPISPHEDLQAEASSEGEHDGEAHSEREHQSRCPRCKKGTMIIFLDLLPEPLDTS